MNEFKNLLRRHEQLVNVSHKNDSVEEDLDVIFEFEIAEFQIFQDLPTDEKNVGMDLWRKSINRRRQNLNPFMEV